ncbi:heterokaryon incompatibility protein [Colletotrichum kahawae]|uniref:Heterokaryon incompatibility protein n=1 Tax=Colletotrichum kahawae TaxID=34407 RepID=A0AAD9YDT6_COLKA|nr:heterokaryon incompatibility protein [Colletotrichum kahawae]
MTAANSDTSIELVCRWFHRCLGRHTTCRGQDHGPRLLPTRLVQLERQTNLSSISAKVCLTSGLPVDTTYVTLSHCWGKPPNTFLKLEKSNCDKLQREGIDFDKLSNTFKDAMRMAIELGVHYIWIDSLCIIQNSKDDWAHESKTMGDVYRFAICNIAATGYQNGETGLFRERSKVPFSYYPLEVNCTLRVVNNNGFTIEQADVNGIYIRLDETDFRKTVNSGILNTRGWVAQERVLSPRIIHYTPEKIWWECSELVANEALPSGDYKRWYDLGQMSIIPKLKKTDKKAAYAIWREFTSVYAGTAITEKTDRFPAMAGVARVVGDLLDDNLVAGFWERDIVRSLAWIYDDKIESIPDSQPAPSWSWASLDTKLRNYGHLICCSEVSADKMSWISFKVLSRNQSFMSDLQSPLSEGSAVCGLGIRGPLRTLPLDFLEKIERLKTLITKIVRYDITEMVPALRENLPEGQRWRRNESTHALLLSKMNDTGLCGLILQQVSEAELEGWKSQQEGLKLEDEAAFRRTGYFQLHFESKAALDEQARVSTTSRGSQSLLFEECGLQDFYLI